MHSMLLQTQGKIKVNSTRIPRCYEFPERATGPAEAFQKLPSPDQFQETTAICSASHVPIRWVVVSVPTADDF
jgi:hypothetical protein